MSELLFRVKAKPAPQPPATELRIVVTPKAVPSTTKDAVTKDDDEMTESVPSCPKCLKADDVLGVQFHDSMADDGQVDETPEADDSDNDGYCCTSCRFTWPAEPPTMKAVEPAPAAPAEASTTQPAEPTTTLAS